MKYNRKLFALFLLSTFSFSGISQCDSLDYKVGGELLDGKKNSLKIRIDGNNAPEKGLIVDVSKKGKNNLFGGNTDFWLGIATAEVIKSSNDEVTVKVIEEKSSITINGEKKNHFVKGTPVRIEWKGKAVEVPHIFIEEGDTIEIGQFLCDQRVGDWKVYYPSGKIRKEISFKNDLLHGPHTFYHENGTVKQKGVFNEGKVEGEYIIYYENGNIKEEGSHANGSHNGPIKFYHSNGQLQTEGAMKDGELHGEVKDYFENGNISTTFTYVNGKRDGRALFYHENHEGVIRTDREYDNGELTGYFKTFYESGKPHVVGYTTNNLLDKEYEEYYESGQLKKKGLLVDTKEEGLWLLYYENGNFEAKSNFSEGAPNGSKESYYENGQLEFKGTFKNNVMVGKWEGFYKDGSKKFKGSYDEEGNKTGTWLTWDESGKRKKEKF